MGISVNEAGRRGGLACFCKQGRPFYVEIGRRGQQEMRRRYPGMARSWGKMGGRPCKQSLEEAGEGKKRLKKKGGLDPPHF